MTTTCPICGEYIWEYSIKPHRCAPQFCVQLHPSHARQFGVGEQELEPRTIYAETAEKAAEKFLRQLDREFSSRGHFEFAEAEDTYYVLVREESYTGEPTVMRVTCEMEPRYDACPAQTWELPKAVAA